MSTDKSHEIADEIAGRLADALGETTLAQRLIGREVASVERNDPGDAAVVSATLQNGDLVQLSVDVFPSEQQL
ncbi:MAG TPA: hypothetical protein VML35_04075 [Gaiellaceae bacterium]|nr:hypothetical protein [Gaiellaceae bacterium]